MNEIEYVDLHYIEEEARKTFDYETAHVTSDEAEAVLLLDFYKTTAADPFRHIRIRTERLTRPRAEEILSLWAEEQHGAQ